VGTSDDPSFEEQTDNIIRIYKMENDTQDISIQLIGEYIVDNPSLRDNTHFQLIEQREIDTNNR